MEDVTTHKPLSATFIINDCRISNLATESDYKEEDILRR